MNQDDIHYYRQRAEREMELAREARHPLAERAHTQLAHHYLDIVEQDVIRPFRERRPRLGLFPATR